MQSFFDHTPDTLAAFFAAKGLKPFISKQVMEWVYQHGITDPQKMTNLAKSVREMLKHELKFEQGREVRRQRATDDTTKLLIEWPRDGAGEQAQPSLALPVHGAPARGRQTECVMIPTTAVDAEEQAGAGAVGTRGGRRTACISSQIGCPVGCRFCASGIGGVDGNLTAGQIVEQVFRLGQLPDVGRITHVVFMGMGEPLANFAQVTAAIRTLNAPWGPGGGISARRITVSTVGLPTAIRKLIAFEVPVTLALSLHAPNDALRRQLIPWAEYAPIDELLSACQEYFEQTGREITLEYLLLREVNDRPVHARELADLAQTLRANVNLIRYNEVKGMPFSRPTSDVVRAFQDILRRARVNTHIRASRGRDIAAACGQLRHEESHASA